MPIIDSDILLVFLNKEKFLHECYQERNFIVNSINAIYNQQNFTFLYDKNYMLNRFLKYYMKEDNFINFNILS